MQRPARLLLTRGSTHCTDTGASFFGGKADELLLTVRVYAASSGFLRVRQCSGDHHSTYTEGRWRAGYLNEPMLKKKKTEIKTSEETRGGGADAESCALLLEVWVAPRTRTHHADTPISGYRLLVIHTYDMWSLITRLCHFPTGL